MPFFINGEASSLCIDLENIGINSKIKGLRMKEARTLDSFAFVYSLHGAGIFESRTIPKRRVAPGNIMLLFPGEWHRYGPDADYEWSEYFFVAKGPLFHMLTEEKIFTPEKAFIESQPNALIETHFREALEMATSRNQGDMRRVCGHILCILNEAQMLLNGGSNEKGKNSVILEIARIIKSEPSKEWDYALLAKEHGMSYSLFRKRFLQVIGKSPHRYHNETRIGLASELLVKGYSIKEIAVNVGLPDPFHFSKVFKSITGCSPSVYISTS